MERPRMFLQEVKDCSTMGRLSSTRPIADAHSGPIFPAQEANRAGDHGLSSAAWLSGICSTMVEYCPFRPRRRPCSATISPSAIKLTFAEESLTSTCSPIRRCGTE